MIVPITSSKSGEVKNIGTARVVPEGDDYSVEFYLAAGFSLSDEAKKDMEKQLKRLARRHEADLKHLKLG